ncbi:MAG: hypothetical protein ABSG38_10350 [Spirochaetia bacterium]
MKTIEREEEKRDVIEILESGDPDTLSEAIARFQHLRVQFKTSYRYLVGEWSDARRAKDTQNGQFVTKAEVVSYLEGNVKE